MPFTRATLLQLYASFAAEQAKMREACEQIFSSSLFGKTDMRSQLYTRCRQPRLA